MKKSTFTLIVIFCLGLSQLGAMTGSSCSLPKFSELNKIEKHIKEKLALASKTLNFPPSNKLQFVEQNCQKGIVDVCCLNHFNNYLLHNFSDEKLYISSQTFYHQRQFFSNEKRGPPSILVF